MLIRYHFVDGRYERFGVDKDIVKAFERIKTNEHTDTDILLLKHELLELTYMKNKKYNIYETAHLMADKKYPWEYMGKGLTNEQILEIINRRLKTEI